MAGGGTGGHVYPGLAIAAELGRRAGSRRFLFVGTEAGLESRLVPAHGYALETIRASGLVGVGLATKLRGIARLPGAIRESHRILGRFRPHLVVGVGGYASGPVLLVAIARRLPTLIHEQNRWPGVTNRILAPWVDRIAVTFPGTFGVVGRRGVVTGNPVAEEFTRVPAWNPTPEPRRVLVFGGSRGARALNNAVAAALPRLRGRVSLHHQTGPADYDRIRKAYEQSGFTDATVEEYIDTMPEALAATDLVVCRAGASTLAELAASGRASILVPFTFATHDHQRQNARAFVDAGASRLLDQAELDGERLAAEVLTLLGAPQELERMAAGARGLARPDAASSIADLAEELMARRAAA